MQHAGIGDFVTGETGVWAFSALTVGLNAEFYRAATPGLPFQVAIQRGVRMLSRPDHASAERHSLGAFHAACTRGLRDHGR